MGARVFISYSHVDEALRDELEVHPVSYTHLDVYKRQGVTFHGTVESITPGTGANFSLIPPQNATGNLTKIVQRVPGRIRIDAGPQARRVLVPGLSLVVKVDTSSAKADLAAIRDEDEKSGR